MSKVEVRYDAPPTMAAFLASQAFVRCAMGPVGSGKSSACCIEILRRAAEQAKGPDGIRRTRFAIIRNAYPELRDTTRKTFEQWIPESLGKWHEAEFLFELKYADVHSEILFRALDRPDDVRKLLSLELTGAYINESKEVPRAVFDMLTGRVGRYPSKIQGGPSWFGIWMDTNPPDSDHWIYRLFEETRPPGMELFRQPSGLSPEAENVENLPQGYYERLCAGKTDDFINVYVKGQYGFVRDGKPIYPEWNDIVHVQECEAVQGFGPVLLGQDFGLTPAAVLAQRDPGDGQIQVFAELVSEDMGAVSFARELATKLKREHGHRKTRGWGDPAGEQRAQTDEKT
ncbi:MAG TPA: phage terminase large subunit, partial [Nocardioidaceae bacterium]|nr:phage terminase large subunit [Nocardioidaceae bacterium]